MKKKLPGHGSCFICGEDNPKNIGITYFLDGENVVTEFTPTLSEQGPPNHTHGGCIAAVLDETMGAVAWCAGHKVVAARLEIDYKKMVPLNEKVYVKAWVEKVEGRKVFTKSELTNKEQVLATGTGLFLALSPEQLAGFTHMNKNQEDDK